MRESRGGSENAPNHGSLLHRAKGEAEFVNAAGVIDRAALQLAGSKVQVIVCCCDISRPMPADTSQVSVPTFTDD